MNRRRPAQFIQRLLQIVGLLLQTGAEFLDLRFQGVKALGELLPVLLILLAQARSRAGARQGNDRESDRKAGETQDNDNDNSYPDGFHKCYPARIARILAPNQKTNNGAR